MGIFVNGFGFIYCAFVIVWSCFPATLPVDYATANWSPLVWIFTGLVTIVYYYAYGIRHYTAPVDAVKKSGGIELQS